MPTQQDYFLGFGESIPAYMAQIPKSEQEENRQAYIERLGGLGFENSI